jgi:VRR-NUC domain
MSTKPLLRITEKHFQAQVLRLAKITGHKVFHDYNSQRSEPGFPDLVIVKHTMKRPIFAELKTETGQLTEDQWAWRLVLDEMPGVDYRLWRPSSWDEIEEAFTGRKPR